MGDMKLLVVLHSLTLWWSVSVLGEKNGQGSQGKYKWSSTVVSKENHNVEESLGLHQRLIDKSSKEVIEELKSPVKPRRFKKNHTNKGIPAVIRKDVLRSIAANVWTNDLYFNSIAHTFTSWYEVGNVGTEKKLTMTFRDFVSLYMNNTLVFSSEVPYYLRNQLDIPSCLRCDKTKTGFIKHSLWISGRKFTEYGRSQENMIRCVIAGNHSFILGKKETEMQQYRYFDDTIHKGDCLYIPPEWSYKMSSTGRVISYTIFWDNISEDIKLQECRDYTENQAISQANFTEVRTPDLLHQHGILHYFIIYMLKKGPMTAQAFVKASKQDEILLEDMIEWNTDIQNIAMKVFDILDTNADDLFSSEDIDYLTPKILENLDVELITVIAELQDVLKKQQDNPNLKKTSKPEKHKGSPKMNEDEEAIEDDQVYSVFEDDVEEEILADDDE